MSQKGTEREVLTRREFLNKSAMGIGSVVAGAAGLCMLGSTQGESGIVNQPFNGKPNVILILADDMGFSDIGCYGSEIRTPNLDRLGRKGVRFSQGYNTARCCPSRAALLTGLYPHQAGVGNMVANWGRPAYQGYLRTDCVTIAEVLRDAGYRTWMTGKWHVGGNQVPNDPSTWHPGAPNQPSPLDRGFDRFFGTLGGAGSYFRPPILMDQGKFITTPQEGFYYTQAIGDRACAMIRESVADKKPFFGYVAFTAPHWPLHALPEDIERYRDRYRAGWDVLRAERYEALKKLGLISSKWPLSPRDPRSPAWNSLDANRRNWETMRMAVYAAMIDRLDQNVGRILECLEATGQRENTVIIFLADNGACEEHLKEDGSNIKRYDLPMTNGQHPKLGNIPDLTPGAERTFMSYGVSWANASNTPFRQFKKWVHEGGIATPIIMNHPSWLKFAGSIVHDPCHNIDLMPTILEIAGAKHPETYHGQRMTSLAGQSLVPVVTGRVSTAKRPLFWEHMGNRAVRVGALKLVADNAGPWELYDLEADRTELNDLVQKFPASVTDLDERYQDWARTVGVENFDELRKKVRSREE
jgi:arylsulfatase A-like enzyme